METVLVTKEIRRSKMTAGNLNLTMFGYSIFVEDPCRSPKQKMSSNRGELGKKRKVMFKHVQVNCQSQKRGYSSEAQTRFNRRQSLTETPDTRTVPFVDIRY